MSIAFVVMQIGDQQLDQLFETVIQPAIESGEADPSAGSRSACEQRPWQRQR